VAGNEHARRLRAELAAELGFFPASLAPEDIERHRRLNAALDAAPSLEKITCKFAHLREEKRRADVERDARAAVADLYHQGDEDDGESKRPPTATRPEGFPTTRCATSGPTT
jgi:hypothetical protein